MAITPNIRFSNSNFVPIKRLEDYDLLQSDTTRLSPDFVYPSITNPCYFINILQSDNLWIQFRTNYVDFQVFIINEAETETEITSNVASGVDLSNDRKQYELFLDLTGYEGYYKLKFLFDQDADKPVATYESEWFNIATEYDNDYLKIECKNGDFNPYDDGIIWSGETQKLYLLGSIVDLMPGVEKSVFTASNYKMKTTQAQPLKSKKLKVELAPDYLYEILNIFLSHDYFYINSVRFNSEETFEIERQGDTRLYPSELTLRVVEDAQGNAYEDYSIDQTITGDLPIIPLDYRTTGLTDRTTGLTERKINN